MSKAKNNIVDWQGVLRSVRGNLSLDPRGFDVDPLRFMREASFDPWPVQIFVLKLLFGFPLSDTDIIDFYTFPQAEYVTYTEKEYINMLYSEKRSNYNAEMYEKFRASGKRFNDALFLWGRKGSKSTIAGCVSSYRAAQLSYSGVPDNFSGLDDVFEVVISQSEAQASVVASMIETFFARSSYIERRKSKHNDKVLNLPTKVRGKIVDMPKLKMVTKGSSAKSIRAYLAHTLILDEIAHFAESSGSKSAEEVYQAAEPATAPFGFNGLTLLITTPLTPDGLVHRLYKEMLELKGGYSLMLQIPTWEASKIVDIEWLKVKEIKNPVTFRCEYGAEFIMASSPFIDASTLPFFTKCFVEKPKRARTAYMGVDLATNQDCTAIAIASRIGSKVSVLHAEEFYPSADGKPIDVQEVIDRMIELKRQYNVKGTIIDQCSGPVFAQRLEQCGYRDVDLVHFSQVLHHQYYENFYYLLQSGDLTIIKDDLIKDRFLMLKKEILPNFRYRVSSRHDDLPDAVVRAVFAAASDERVAYVEKKKKKPSRAVQERHAQAERRKYFRSGVRRR